MDLLVFIPVLVTVDLLRLVGTRRLCRLFVRLVVVLARRLDLLVLWYLRRRRPRDRTHRLARDPNMIGRMVWLVLRRLRLARELLLCLFVVRRHGICLLCRRG